MLKRFWAWLTRSKKKHPLDEFFPTYTRGIGLEELKSLHLELFVKCQRDWSREAKHDAHHDRQVKWEQEENDRRKEFHAIQRSWYESASFNSFMFAAQNVQNGMLASYSGDTAFPKPEDLAKMSADYAIALRKECKKRFAEFADDAGDMSPFPDVFAAQGYYTYIGDNGSTILAAGKMVVKKTSDGRYMPTSVITDDDIWILDGLLGAGKRLGEASKKATVIHLSGDVIPDKNFDKTPIPDNKIRIKGLVA